MCRDIVDYSFAELVDPRIELARRTQAYYVNWVESFESKSNWQRWLMVNKDLVDAEEMKHISKQPFEYFLNKTN